MRLVDLVLLILTNLSRRKGRVFLTAIGVVIGTAAVVVLVSTGIGLQRNAESQLFGIGEMTHIQVYPGYQETFVGGNPLITLVTEQSLLDFSAIPGVERVIPKDFVIGGALIKLKQLEGYSNIIGIGTNDLSELDLSVSQGTLNLERGTIIVGSQVNMNFYDPKLRPGAEPPQSPELFDQILKFILLKYDSEGLEIRKTVQLQVVGVLAETGGESDWSMYMSLDDISSWNEWFLNKRINRNRDGYSGVVVIAADAKNTLEIAQSITDMGYSAYSSQPFIQGISNFYLILQIGFGGIGAIALFVAAIGIANTMAMAILERTREIGLMKAVGAKNRQILTIFLGEASGIGLLGGIGGITLGWVIGEIVNLLGQVYLASQITQETYGGMPSISVHTPIWLLIFALVFSTLVGLLSGIYPALNAANMSPIYALKYE